MYFLLFLDDHYEIRRKPEITKANPYNDINRYFVSLFLFCFFFFVYKKNLKKIKYH